MSVSNFAAESSSSTNGVNMELEEAVAKWKEAGEREKAAIEEKLWQRAGKEIRMKYNRVQYLTEVLGESSTYLIDARQVLYNVGEIAAPLWERIDKKEIPLGTAVRFLRDVRKTLLKEGNRNRDAFINALKEKLVEYDKLSSVAFTKDGFAMRKSVPNFIKHDSEKSPASSSKIKESFRFRPSVSEERFTRMSVEELVEQYKNGGLTWKQKASVENEVWQKADKKARGDLRREEYIIKILGEGTGYKIHDRGSLWNKGAVADPLWDRINRDELPVKTGVRLLHDALVLARQRKINVDIALQEVLTKYDSLSLSHNSEGIPIRIRSTSRLPDLAKERLKLNKRTSKNEAAESETSFWFKWRREIASFAAAKLEGVEEANAQELWRSMERDLKALFSEFQSRIERVKQSGKKQALVSRRDVIDACRVLGMDPPRRGEPVDLKLAQKQKKILVREYHPDLNTDEKNREKLEDVIKAFYVIESYSQQLKTGPRLPNN